MEATVLIFLLFILALSIFLGLEMASKIPAPQRVSYISGSKLVSGVIVLAGILAAGDDNNVAALLGGFAVALGVINFVVGYSLTDRTPEQ